jgi:hypothetical protein
VPDTVRTFIGSADPPWLPQRRPRLPARLRLDVPRPELVQADDRSLTGVGEIVEFENPVLLGLEVRVVERFQVLTA